MQVLENEIYTTQETLSLLKISKSTFLRLIKKGVLSACKVGGQYRILGKEIMALFNPKVQQAAHKAYQKVHNSMKSRLETIEEV